MQPVLKRRSSLFRLTSFSQNCDEALLPTVQYPPEYCAKLDSEVAHLASLKIDAKKEEETELNEFKKKLQSAKLLNEVKITEEQEDFLASLPDYDNYIEKVTKFTNQMKTAIEMANIHNRMKEKEKLRTLELVEKKILKCCKDLHKK